MKLKRESLAEKQKVQSAQIKEKEGESLLLAETEANTVLGECSVLGDLMPDEHWTDADDSVISENVRNLSKWQSSGFELSAVIKDMRICL